MDFAAMSIGANLSSLQQALSIVTLEKAMNQDAASVASVVETLQESNPPVASGGVGYALDVRA